MDAFALVLIVCGGSALLALALSMTTKLSLARQLGKTSLWIALAAVPVGILLDLARMWLGVHDAYSEAFVVGRTISHAMNYGVLVLPCAAIAGLALRRANSRRG